MGGCKSSDRSCIRSRSGEEGPSHLRCNINTTVVTNPAARLRVSCNGIVARMPGEPFATPTIPRPRPPAGGDPRAGGPATDGPRVSSVRSAPARPPTFFRRAVGQLTDRRQDGKGEQGEGDVPVPTGPASHLVVGQPDLLLGRLEAALDRPSSPGRLRQSGQRRAARAGRQVVRQFLALIETPPDQQPPLPLRPRAVVDRQPRPGVPPRALAAPSDRDLVPGPPR